MILNKVLEAVTPPLIALAMATTYAVRLYYGHTPADAAGAAGIAACVAGVIIILGAIVVEIYTPNNLLDEMILAVAATIMAICAAVFVAVQTTSPLTATLTLSLLFALLGFFYWVFASETIDEQGGWLRPLLMPAGIIAAFYVDQYYGQFDRYWPVATLLFCLGMQFFWLICFWHDESSKRLRPAR